MIDREHSKRCRRVIAAVAMAIHVVVPASLSHAAERPRLAVVIVVDQMRADYLNRFAGYYSGGLSRLMRDGIVFSEAYHDHALTYTAVGHAAVATGCFPSRHGIVGNEWFERASGRAVYCCADTGTVILGGTGDEKGRSPHHLLHGALGDWLKGVSPRSKVYAVSEKDRAAILMGGLHPDGAFWYDDGTGGFVTSTYYMKQLPGWVEAFNSSGLVGRRFREGWSKGWPEETYFVSREDAFFAENDGVHTAFPHPFDTSSGVAGPAFFAKLESTPFADELLFEFARSLVEAERLGSDTVPDLLWVSCSSTDRIGHAFGPLSQEIEDDMLRLDGYVGEFLQFLDSAVGDGRYLVALTADHGVMPLPEELKRRGIPALRIPEAEYDSAIGAAAGETARALGIAESLIVDLSNGIVLDTTAAVRRGVALEDLRRQIAARLRQVSYVDEVMTYDELTSPHAIVGGYRDAYRRSFIPERTPDLVLRLGEYDLVSDSRFGTSHGSPYRYDTHVPLILAGHGVPGDGVVSERVRVIDLAPTVATLLGITPPEDIDGVVLRRAVSR